MRWFKKYIWAFIVIAALSVIAYFYNKQGWTLRKRLRHVRIKEMRMSQEKTLKARKKIKEYQKKSSEIERSILDISILHKNAISEIDNAKNWQELL